MARVAALPESALLPEQEADSHHRRNGVGVNPFIVPLQRVRVPALNDESFTWRASTSG